MELSVFANELCNEIFLKYKVSYINVKYMMIINHYDFKHWSVF